MFPEWRTIIHQRLPCMVNYPLATEREEGRRNATKTVSKCPTPHVILALYAGRAWQRTVMPGVIRSSKLLTSLNKKEEMHKTREAKKWCQTPHQTLPSPVDTAHDPAFLAKGLQSTWTDFLIFVRNVNPLYI